MKEYKYDKKLLKGYSIKPFLNEVKNRNKHINEASDTIPSSTYNANLLASKLHPSKQYAVIDKIIEQPNAKTFVFKCDKEKGTEKFAFFKAGQYLSVELNINGETLYKPYSICSSPNEALDSENSSYSITVKEVNNGYASNYILKNFKIGDKVTLSSPLGSFTYNSIRDCKNVISVAGGSGITPFLSLAKAIAEGNEDFNLTILYGNRDYQTLLFKDELLSLQKQCLKIKVIFVLENESKDGCEKGFITSTLIKKYAKGDDYSLFVCGPSKMYDFLDKQANELNLPNRRYRKEIQGEIKDVSVINGFNLENKDKVFKVLVKFRDLEKSINCRGDESLLVAMEKAGIKAPSHCRSGSCGFCHSLLLSGEVFIPTEFDRRREADKKFNFIHPCVTYPITDLVIDVPTILD